METAVCAHCGLPAGRRAVGAVIDGAAERFCCYGCVLARQITRSHGESGAAASAFVRLGLAVFFAMNAMMVSLPTYVPAIYGDEAGPIDGPLFLVLRVLAMVLTAPVLVLLGGPILAGALRGLRAGGANTDALIVLGTAAAYALSVAHVLQGSSEVYFDTVAMLLVLMTLGRYLEARARAEAGEAISRTLAGEPRPVCRLAAIEATDGTAVAADTLVPGDFVRITAGETFPADGVVVAGSGGVDQSLLTGEHRPSVFGLGDSVAGGATSIDGVFVLRLTARAADSTRARIERILSDARRQRTPSQLLADRVSAVMLPLVIALALASGVYWSRVDGIDRGVLVALAVLCVACPCGLGIATPVALWTALQQATRRGIVVRNPAALERLARVRLVFFDKTGTLTERTPSLAGVEVAPDCGWSAADVVALAAAVERGQLHPVARALEAAAAARPAARFAVADVRVLPGLGVRASVDGVRTTVGSLPLAATELGRRLAPASAEGGVMEVAVWQPGHLLARIRLRETLRPEAAAAAAELEQMGFRLALLTGDTQARAVSPSLIAPTAVRLGLAPEEKLAVLRRAGAAAMVGDGINDGPALAAAEVGIAVCAAADLARTTADVVLMTEDLRVIPWLAALGRRTEAVIRQNLLWSFAYNGIAVALAAGALLSPLVATVAMIGSSLLVVANSRRLRRPDKADAPVGPAVPAEWVSPAAT